MFLLKSAILFIFIAGYIGLSLVVHLIWLIFRKVNLFLVLSNLTMLFCKVIAKLFNLRINLIGNVADLKQKGILIISNHLSYLDGVVLGSLVPVVFVTKKQVRSWPIFGLLTRASSTIYIDRQHKLQSQTYINQIVKIIKQGANILIFPEGTSSNGEYIRGFQSVFFQVPIISSAYILPLTINYRKINQRAVSIDNRDNIFWYGQLKFTRHILNALKLKEVTVDVRLHPLVKAQSDENSKLNRKQLGKTLREIIKKDYQPITE